MPRPKKVPTIDTSIEAIVAKAATEIVAAVVESLKNAALAQAERQQAEAALEEALQWSHHPHIKKRVLSLHRVLMESFAGGALMSNPTKGVERELFVRSFLSQSFSPMHRFGSGDIVDSYKEISGQLDVVLPFPEVALSFPMHPEGPRLYLAEGVAAVIEVKSDVANQWDDVLRTARNVKKLKRRWKRQNLEAWIATREKYFADGGESAEGDLFIEQAKREMAALPPKDPSIDIPVIAVGFTGWSTSDGIRQNLDGSPVDAVLVLDSLLWESNIPNRMTRPGWMSLLDFLEVLAHHLAMPVTRDPLINIYDFWSGLDPATIVRADIPPPVAGPPVAGPSVATPKRRGRPPGSGKAKVAAAPAPVAKTKGSRGKATFTTAAVAAVLALISAKPGQAPNVYRKASKLGPNVFKNVLLKLKAENKVKVAGVGKNATYRVA